MAKSSAVQAVRRSRLAKTMALATLLTVWSVPLWAASPPPTVSDVKRTPFPPLTLAQPERMAALTTTTTPAAQGRFELAPTPNFDLFAPRVGAASAGPVVGPSMFQQKSTYRGEGFVEGSSPQVVQQSRHMSLPGISLKVPLN